MLGPVHVKAMKRIAEKFANNPNLKSPLEYLISVYSDENEETKTRIYAAEKIAAYVHVKMPETVEHEHTGQVESVHRMLRRTCAARAGYGEHGLEVRRHSRAAAARRRRRQ